jgi:hypothetical protein
VITTDSKSRREAMRALKRYIAVWRLWQQCAAGVHCEEAVADAA